MIVGIDACRIRSGGGVAHLIGILSNDDPRAHGIEKVHVWSYKSLLDSLPDVQWLAKHNPTGLERDLVHQVWWQFRKLPEDVRRTKCDILFTADASTVCRFWPSVVLSQDMQSYEPGVMKSYGLSVRRLRLLTIGYLQTQAMKRANGVIFLTQYASQVIQKSTGRLAHVRIIPHGIGTEFRHTTLVRERLDTSSKEIRCVYVSEAAPYKHQWIVVRAIGKLREQGYKVSLLLVGGGTGRARRMTDEAIAEVDPRREFVQVEECVPHNEIPNRLAQAGVFIFASSCENLPNTLLEAMASGLPIACSDRGPMPEILKDGGVYFDPEKPDSIAKAVKTIIKDYALRVRIARKAKELSEQYSWARCSADTWQFIRDCVENKDNRGETNPL